MYWTGVIGSSVEAQSNKLLQANQQAPIQTYEYSTKGDFLGRAPAEGGGWGGLPPSTTQLIPTPPHTSKIALIATRNSTTMDRKRMKNHHPSLTLKKQQFKNNKQTTLKHCSDDAFYVTQEGTSG